MHRGVYIPAGLAMIVLAAAIATAQQGAVGGEWRWHSGDPGSTKYAPLDQINKDNVSRLRIAWRRPGSRRQPRGEDAGPHVFPATFARRR